MALDWLCHAFDADRVDGGFVNPALAVYKPQAEAVRDGLLMPSSVDAAIDVRDASVRNVLASSSGI